MILSSRASRATTTAFSPPYTKTNTYLPISSKRCTLLYTCVACFVLFFIGMLPFIVRAYLVCVAHKNENIKHENKKGGAGFRTRDLPTCPSEASVYTAVYMCRVFFFLVGMLPFVVGTYLVCVAWSCVLYCKCVPGIILSSRATTALWTAYIKTNISSSWVYEKQHHQQQACTLL